MNCEPCTHNLKVKENISPAELLERAAYFTGISASELTGERGPAEVADVRHMVAEMLYSDGRYSMQGIATILGRKNHTTIVHARRKVKNLLFSDREFKNKFETLRDYIFKYSKTIQ